MSPLTSAYWQVGTILCLAPNPCLPSAKSHMALQRCRGWFLGNQAAEDAHFPRPMCHHIQSTWPQEVVLQYYVPTSTQQKGNGVCRLPEPGYPSARSPTSQARCFTMMPTQTGQTAMSQICTSPFEEKCLSSCTDWIISVTDRQTTEQPMAVWLRANPAVMALAKMNLLCIPIAG